MPDIIIIDPGHGGTANVGGSGWNHATSPTGLLEKAVTLQVALETVQRLRQQSYDARLTRDRDVNLGLAARAQVASNANARVFVSIHFNGNNDPAVQGTETWVHTLHSPDSALLASSVQSHVRAATGYRDRGVKRGQLGVLDTAHHDFNTARCLAEISFMTDPQDDLRLRDPAHIQRLGRAVAQGITDFLRGMSTPPPPVEEFPVPNPNGDI